MLHGGLFHSNEVTIEDLLQINRCMFSLQDIPKGVIMMVMMRMVVMMMMVMRMMMMMVMRILMMLVMRLMIRMMVMMRMVMRMMIMMMNFEYDCNNHASLNDFNSTYDDHRR